jgi:hypothetical protein
MNEKLSDDLMSYNLRRGFKLVAFLAVFVIGLVITSGCYTMSTYEESESIYNLDNPASMVSGHFVLGSGYVNTNLCYLYYIQNERGNYELKWVDASITEISMDEENNPYVVKTMGRSCDSDDPLRKAAGGGITCHPSFPTHAVFHVPKGTITQTYSLGAK